MGDSKPPAAAVDLLDSYARRVGDDVEVVLVDPEGVVSHGDAVVLRRGERRREAPAEVVEDGHGRRALVRVPRADLGNGQWGLRVRAGADGATPQPLGCRLLVQGDRPLVLLWGQRGAPSRTPEPHPRGGAAVGLRGRAARRAHGLVRRVARRVRS